MQLTKSVNKFLYLCLRCPMEADRCLVFSIVANHRQVPKVMDSERYGGVSQIHLCVLPKKSLKPSFFYNIPEDAQGCQHF